MIENDDGGEEQAEDGEHERNFPEVVPYATLIAHRQSPSRTQAEDQGSDGPHAEQPYERRDERQDDESPCILG